MYLKPVYKLLCNKSTLFHTIALQAPAVPVLLIIYMQEACKPCSCALPARAFTLFLPVCFLKRT
eukprot:scaffold204497_cov19-Tisochrysis_lutea.AAC.1